MMSNEKYTPISCDYYDELELFALRKIVCELLIKENDTEELIKGKIETIYARKGEEFLLLESKREIRLDKIISVNGKIRNHYSC